MDVSFAGMLNRGETLKLRDLNAAFQNPKTISLAYYQASLLVEHLMAAYGQPGLNKLLRTYGQGLDTDAALKAALDTDLDKLQVGFDQTVEQTFGTMRRAMTMPAGVEDLRKTPTAELEMLAEANPRSFPVQAALGRALRKDGRHDEAMRAFERAAALVPAAGGAESPHEQMAAMALEKKDRPRAIAELTALVAVDFNNVEAARQLSQLMRQESVEDPVKLRPVYQRIAAIDPFDADAHTMLRPLCDAAQRAGRGVTRVPGGHRPRPGRSRRGLHGPRRELFQRRQTRRSEEADARGARNRAELRARAGIAAEAGGPMSDLRAERDTRRRTVWRSSPFCWRCSR